MIKITPQTKTLDNETLSEYLDRISTGIRTMTHEQYMQMRD